MPRMKPADKKATLEERKRQLEAQIKAIDARAKETSRKEDTRRKVIAGALAIEHMEKNPQDPFAIKMRELLDKFVEPRSRSLFPGLTGIASPTSKGNEFGNG